MKVAKNEKNLAKCLCLQCPSYSQECQFMHVSESANSATEKLEHLQHYEQMFCAFEKSHCIHLNKGCLCYHCDIHKKYDLSQHEYCMKTGGL